MITLFQFYPGGGLPNLSPFCLKLETWLRMTGLEYRNEYTWNPGKGPLGKLPAIELDGKLIADSQLCITTLKQRFGVDPDQGLSEEQRATAHAFRVLFEDHLYWTMVYARWVEPAGWMQTRDYFFGRLPSPLRQLVPVVARRQMLRELQGHGMSRHAPEQVYRFAADGLKTLAAFLGDKPFFLGDAPRDIDAVAFAFLSQATLAQLHTPITELAKQHPALRAYCLRMQERYFP